MIQSGLFFVLGFASAVFLALMIAPALWRRAGYLMRKRVESSVALTANEVQSEKDRLRAEHARSLRKLEMKADALRDEKAALMANTSRQAEALTQMTDTLAERDALVAELEEAKMHLETSVSETEMSIAALNLQLQVKDSEIEVLKHEFSTVKASDADARDRLASLMETLEQRESENQSGRERLAALTEKRREDQARLREMRAHEGDLSQQLRTERSRTQSLEGKLERAIREKTDLEERLGRRENDLVRLREAHAADSVDLTEWETRLADAERDRAELEKELADMTLSYNNLRNSGRSGDHTDALQAELNSMQIQLGSLKADLKSALRERDRARSDAATAMGRINVPAGSGPVSMNLHGERAPAANVNDDVLRDQMNQIAAEMVTLTAILEGDDSPINDIIDRGDHRENGDAISLADRIRQLRGRFANAAE